MGLLFNFIKPEKQEVTAALAPFTIREPNLFPFRGTSSTRAEAMSVPAVARGRNIICGTIASIPLELRGRDMSKLPVPNFLQQPDPRTPTSVLMAYTAEDILFFGRAFWQITEMDETTNRPRSAQWIEQRRVTEKLDPTGYIVTGYQIDSAETPQRGVGSLIAFSGLDEGVLHRAGRTIRTAASLERAVEKYANEPIPSVVLKSNQVLSPERVTNLLSTWRQSRQERSTAFINENIEFEHIGFNSSELQLAEARQYLVSEIARLMGIPEWYLGAAAGGSMTYSNVTDERKTLVDFSLRPIMTAIEQRLTLDDITLRGTTVRFNLDDFLRGNASDRADIYTKLIPLGVLSVEEARNLEDMVV
jgi:HK97 family phage portal protein